jgi:hypothetical protein
MNKMPAIYNQADILARISNNFFAQYAKHNNIFTNLDIQKLKESNITPILEEIKALPDDEREKVEKDLRHIAELSEKKRINILFSELKKVAAESLPEFKKIGSSHDKAIWTLIHHPDLFHKALYLTSFYVANGTFTKFKYPADNRPDIAEETRGVLGKRIREYFLDYDGRGKFCEIEYYEFNSKHYLIASPSEHESVKREYKNNGKLEPTKRQDAFTAVFIFSDDGDAVDIYVNAPLEVKRSLFTIWAKEIIKLDNVDTEFKPSFELSAFKVPEPDLQSPLSSKVKSIAIYKMYFIPVHDTNKTYEIGANIDVHKKALYDELNAKNLKPIHIKKVWIEATIQEGDKEKTIRFELGESSSNLKHEGEIAIELRQFLKDVGIDKTK